MTTPSSPPAPRPAGDPAAPGADPVTGAPAAAEVPAVAEDGPVTAAEAVSEAAATAGAASPDDVVPDDEVPGDVVPGEDVPDERVSDDGTAEGVPVEDPDVEEVAAGGVEEAPADVATTDAPADDAPAEVAVVEVEAVQHVAPGADAGPGDADPSGGADLSGDADPPGDGSAPAAGPVGETDAPELSPADAAADAVPDDAAPSEDAADESSPPESSPPEPSSDDAAPSDASSPEPTPEEPEPSAAAPAVAAPSAAVAPPEPEAVPEPEPEPGPERAPGPGPVVDEAVPVVATAAAAASVEPPAEVPPEVPVAPRVRAPLTGRARLRSALHPRATRAQVFTGVLCMALGVGLVVQVRQNDQTDLTSLRESELISLLDDTSQRADRLQTEAGELTRTREDLVSSSDQLEAARQVADARLQVLGILAGTLPATGSGMTMTISGTGVTADTLLAAVQELRDAGAEAIQIGDVRIVASSYFLEGAAPGEVVIDGTTVRAPYRFTAIGDQDSLSTAMSFPGGVVDTVEGSTIGGTVVVSAESSVEVTALHSVTEPAYAQVPEPSADAGS